MKMFLLGMFILLLMGCGKELKEATGFSDPGESCSIAYTCDYTGDEIEACCTVSQCRYIVGDKEFRCNGTNCNNAAHEVAEYCVR
jgi:hypothetical protein